MKNIIMGAAPCPMKIKEDILAWFGPVLREFYGSTELGINTVLHPEEQLAKPGSCGRAVPGVELKIVNEHTLKEVPIGQEGVIYFKRNDNMIDEYHRAPDKTNQLFNQLEGYATVGDIGKLDKEGFLFICDRLIDMIISAGVNIYPAEIEDVLHRHPAVFDVAVFGVPDPHWGERVHASIVLKDGESVTEKEIIEFSRKRMADYKVPREVTFHKAEEFPRDSAGKILKRKLREPYWKGQKSRL